MMNLPLLAIAPALLGKAMFNFPKSATRVAPNSIVEVEELPTDPAPEDLAGRISRLEEQYEDLRQRYVDLSNAQQTMLNRWINQR